VLKALIIGTLLVIIVVSGSYFMNLKTINQWPPAGNPSPTPQVSIVKPTLLTPQPDSTITGPLVIKGYVPKSWTFEGQFRMQLLDDKRQLIIEDRVPVERDSENQKETLYFIESYNFHTMAKSGFLVLADDNPSGLPENQKSTEIQIKFASPPTGTVYLFDQGSGNPEIDNECQIILPRAVDIGISKTPIKDTLNLLARHMHPDFYVKSLNLEDGILSIDFPDIPSFTTGGSCAQGINRLMVEKTALQFPEVKQIKLSAGMFQP
jgi:hypothetical protein